MFRALEYHRNVRRLFSPAAALSSLIGVFLFLPLICPAQVNAPHSSVTSPGVGGRAVNGTSPSVTSVGPRGYAPRASGPNHPVDDSHRRARHDGGYAGPYWYAYPVPYYVDPDAYGPEEEQPNDESNYQGGPTVFDRRGAGAGSYIPPEPNAPPAHASDEGGLPTSTPDPAPSTTLVFKDGHKLDIENYAIVGSTLFDLTPGHPRRIPLTDIDLNATKKENDDRGVNFDVPASLGS